MDIEVKTAHQRLQSLLRKYPKYDSEAYSFIYEALEYTKKLKAKKDRDHVAIRELLEGFRMYSIEQFGFLAKTVLNCWGIETTKDIGDIVFNLMEFDLIGKSEKDSREDFNNVYDFNKVFDIKPYAHNYNSETEEWRIIYNRR